MASRTCARCRDGIPHEIKHGTASGAVYCVCKCGLCRAHRSEKSRRHYDKNQERIRDYKIKRYKKYSGYIISQSMKRENRCQAETLRAAIRNGLPWTDAEIKIIMRQDISRKEKCFMTGRTARAVSAKLWSINRAA